MIRGFHKLASRFSLTAVLLAIACMVQAQTSIDVYYIGNMGVHIKWEGGGCLIDGLHDYYGPNYQYPDSGLISSMLNRVIPFDETDLLVITHVHHDHFDSDMSARFLENRTRGRLLAPAQVLDTLARHVDSYADIQSQCRSMDAGPYHTEKVNIEFTPVRHTFQQRHYWVENYLVELKIADRTIVHLGDAEASKEAFAGVKSIESVDLLIIPFWFLLSEDARDLAVSYFNPKVILATHLSPLIDEDTLASMKKLFPSLILGREPGHVTTIQN
ncbi:MAG: MBL fold metallo-hydrolase [Saprospiraceae bacterium]|nr:MBL fold metallo-hydrolase [Saprospiraceae bacterium]